MGNKKKIIKKSKIILSFLFLFCMLSSQAISLELTNSLDISNKRDAINPYDATFFEKNYWAVLIGINDYPGTSGDLPFSVNEINSFKNTLLNKGSWNESHIIVLKDFEASHLNIFNALEWLAEQETRFDVSIIYFVGHGGKIDKNYTFSAYDSKVFDYELDEMFDSYDGRIVLIMDCCKSGGFVETVKGRGRMIMAACDKDGLTYQYKPLKSGFFGYFLNLTLEKLTFTAEATFLIAAPLTYLYSRRLSEELEQDYTVKPKSSDKTIGPIRLIKPGFLNFLKQKSDIDLIPFHSNSVENKLWLL